MTRRDRWSKDGVAGHGWIGRETNRDALRAVVSMRTSLAPHRRRWTAAQRIGINVAVARAARQLRKRRRIEIALNQFTPLKRRLTFRRPR